MGTTGTTTRIEERHSTEMEVKCTSALYRKYGMWENSRRFA